MKGRTDSTHSPGGKRAKPGAPTFNGTRPGTKKIGQMTTGRGKNIRRGR